MKKDLCHEDNSLSRGLLHVLVRVYYPGSSAGWSMHMNVQVEAEREQRIQTEVKEIQKVFFCELCNKQYKLAIEFETHLSSYDHNHKKVRVLALHSRRKVRGY